MDNAGEVGAFRDNNEIDVIDALTGEVVHHPPDAADIDAMMNDLYTFFNTDNDHDIFIHPLVKASIVHFMIGYIHPFADGNGRTARALFYWYLLRKGYWLTEYLSISRLILKTKGQYARAFRYTEIDDNDLTYFILFNLKITKQAFGELKEYIERENRQKQIVLELITIDGVSQRQAIILQWFLKDGYLMIGVTETVTRLAISTVAARNNLMELVELGFLDVIHSDKKTYAFRKGKKFDKLTSKKK